MQIKTISRRYYYPSDVRLFDNEVNEALSEGWILKKRYATECETDKVLLAEMVKDEPPVCRPLTYNVSLDMSEAERQIDELKGRFLYEKIRVKYFDDIEPIQKIAVGDWIDLRSAERVEMRRGDYRLIRLGVGMILPSGYEAHVLPRSSTPCKFGIVSANAMGIIDNSYSGDDDEWKFPAVAIRDTVIEKGERIAQFRIVENQPRLFFETVAKLNPISRGGIGSTGTK